MNKKIDFLIKQTKKTLKNIKKYRYKKVEDYLEDCLSNYQAIKDYLGEKK